MLNIIFNSLQLFYFSSKVVSHDSRLIEAKQAFIESVAIHWIRRVWFAYQ